MKSAIVKSGPMPVRDLPHYWTPEQVRQILAVMPAGQALTARPADGPMRKLAGPRRPAITLG